MKCFMNILLVEDHKNMVDLIFDYMELKGYELDHAYNGQQGYELAKNERYDLIILDLSLPRMDGITVCKKLREEGIDTPVLMLTGKDTKDDILTGFSSGADDYLAKPFELEILEARIKALVRRERGETSANQCTFGDLRLDYHSRILLRKSREIYLNPTQFSVLKLLMLRAPDVVTREEICAELWGDESPDNDVLRGHIYQLRCLIDKPFKSNSIRTIPKCGYRLEHTD